MNHLKKVLWALAVTVSLGLVGASSALAQTTSCTANSVPTLVRDKGIAELTGSIVLNCGTTGAGIPAGATLTVSIQPASAVITNSPAFPPTIDIGGVINPGGAPTISGNTVSFPVGALAAATTPVITIGVNPGVAGTAGIRANVFASGVTFPQQISTLITSSPAGTIAITNNILNVAIPQPGLTASFGTTPGIAQCTSAQLGGVPTALTLTGQIVGTPSAAAVTALFAVTNPTGLQVRTPAGLQLITATEGFPQAFQPVGAGFEGVDSTQGTRIIVSIASLPSNVLLIAPNYVTASFVGGAGTAPNFQIGLVAGADANGAGGASPAAVVSGGAGILGLTVVTGNTITYEVTASSNAVNETINIPVASFTTGTPSPGGTVAATVQLAPVSTVGTPVTTPIPRFGASPISGNVLTIIACLTNILFPWAANTAGYDTGFAVANTTSDIFGTSSQTGTCTYNFFGNNAPSGGTFTTASFAGGVVDTRLLSAIAPGFSGYIIVQCGFQLGHGFEFISNGFGGGAVTVGQGGPGLIILQPAAATGGTSRRGLASAGPAAFGEALGH
ncbi:MAG: hypothetical protein HYX72_07415 [Acidobacteria bacterium]|nr:hypothetical protein [Acidobacteriota bacterium]